MTTEDELRQRMTELDEALERVRARWEGCFPEPPEEPILASLPVVQFGCLTGPREKSPDPPWSDARHRENLLLLESLAAEAEWQVALVEQERQIRDDRARLAREREPFGSWTGIALRWEGPRSSPPVYVSDALRELGHEPEELLSGRRSFLDLLHEEDRVAMEASEPGSWEGSAASNYRIVRPDGEVRWIHEVALRRLGPRNDDVLLDALLLDVTDRGGPVPERVDQELQWVRRRAACLHSELITAFGIVNGCAKLVVDIVSEPEDAPDRQDLPRLAASLRRATERLGEELSGLRALWAPHGAEGEK